MEYFSKRVEKVEDELAPWGVRVPSGGELEAADEQVEERVAELKAAAGIDRMADSALMELGSRWASGELKVETVLSRISSAANIRRGEHPSRLGIVLQGAQAQLCRELDCPEFSERALRESCVEPARKVLEAAAVELVESWRELPGWIQDRVRGEKVPRLSSVAERVDTVTTAGADLDAVRRVASVWQRWGSTRNHYRDIGPFEYLGLGRRRREGNRRVKDDPSRERKLEYAVLWSSAAAELGAGFSLDRLVIDGLVDELEPLADPLGTQAEEYDRRLGVFDRVRGWRENEGIATVPGAPRKALAERNRRQGLAPGQVLVEMREEGLL